MKWRLRRGVAALLLAACAHSHAAQHRRVSADRHLRHLQPRGAEGRADHPLRARPDAARPTRSPSRASTPASFTEQNIIAKATFDDRPSAANQQKRAFAGQLEQFVDDSYASPYTDITGGVLQAIEFLNEKQPGRKEILIFSDMKEDLAQGLHPRPAARPERLRSGRAERHQAAHGQRRSARIPEPPRRVAHRVEKGGGRWRVINDLEHLDALL